VTGLAKARSQSRGRQALNEPAIGASKCLLSLRWQEDATGENELGKSLSRRRIRMSLALAKEVRDNLDNVVGNAEL